MKIQNNILSVEEIQKNLNTEWIGRNTCFFKSTVSTNIDGRKLIEEGAPNGTLIVAEEQTGGRGRRGRTWDSPAGESIYMTLALKPEFEPNIASMLTLVMAYAVALGIRQVTGLDAGIKWPNDIAVNKRKLCGILTEMSLENASIGSVVIGVGINVNQAEFADELKGTATSVFIESGQKVSRALLIGRIMDIFEKAYEQFVEKQNLSFLQEEYNQMLINCDRQVRVLEPKGAFEGVALGINTIGELMVRKEDGQDVCIYAGEVSVRGLYGYV